MTLSDLATFVCNTVNMSETSDVAACKSFLQRRFEMIWNDGLWKDSLCMFTASVSAAGSSLLSSLWMPSRGTFVCPAFVDRVLAVRTDQRHLNVQRQEAYYRIDYDTFAKVGTPSEFVLLSPVVYEWDLPTSVSIGSQAADNGAKVSLSYLDVDNLSPVVLATTLPVSPVTTQAVTAFTKIATTQPVTLQQGTNVLVTLQNTDVAAPKRQRFQLLVRPDPGRASTVETLVTADAPTYDFNGNVFYTNKLSVGRSYRWAPGVNEISISPLSGVPYLTSGGTFIATDTTAVVQGPAGQLFPQVSYTGALYAEGFSGVSNPINLRILVKSKPPQFVNDTDEPQLTNVENCLIAFAHADMLVRGRQYGKASAKAQEASSLLDQLKRIETLQQAHEQHLVPEVGYMDDWDLRGHQPLGF